MSNKYYISLTPQSKLQLTKMPEKSSLSHSLVTDKRIINAFYLSQGEGLLSLLWFRNMDTFSPALRFWRKFLDLFMDYVCNFSSSDLLPILSRAKLEPFIDEPPNMIGIEYLSQASLRSIWYSFGEFLKGRIKENYTSGLDFISKEVPSWNSYGEICFHLTDDNKNKRTPFNFIATYALPTDDKIKNYKPLHQAVNEFTGSDKKGSLNKLFEPIINASKYLTWLQEIVSSREIYYPLAWSNDQAYTFLKSSLILEEHGIIVRVPDWWTNVRKPKIRVEIGDIDGHNMGLGKNSLLDFKVAVSLEDEDLTDEEIKYINSSTSSLLYLRDKWVEIDKERLFQAIE